MPPAEDIPFTLLGPKPEVPPGFWSSYWGGAVLVVLFVAVLALVGWRLRRRAPAARPPLAQLEAELAAAEAAPAAEAVVRVTRAFRAYLFAVDARALPALATEELLAVTGVIPVFLPARQPLTAALRSADAAKFAGAALETSLLIAGVREAARRVEDARRTFARPVAPLVPPRTPVAPAVTMVSTGGFGAVVPVPTENLPAPTTPTLPPPLPVPPPLPRRDQA
ncbi:MAG: hypothetical protein FJ384_03870 [Verrucomicrobia bacterium]|nr:hypothetical protein [Verrucomicrobiota bacterium]